MTDVADRLVSRSDIARMAGVRRPAVTNWERRHPDFPVPVTPGVPDTASTEPEVFRAGEVLEWLSGRAVQSNALRPGEPSGTTYGDRFRTALAGGLPGKLLAAVDQLALGGADRFRGRLRLPDYLNLLLRLVFVRVTDSERWADHMDHPEAAFNEFTLVERPGRAAQGEDFGSDKELSEAETATILDVLHRNPPATPDEGREAFDRLLGLFRDADARAGAEFFTPPSVSRVMARALAAHHPPAAKVHDPFCRTGELLSAYLDVVGEQGGTAPYVSGRGPREEELRLAWMNATLHGAQVVRIAPGPATPAEGPPGPASVFDAVITNPPFGGRLDRSGPPQRYWRYVTPRTVESDWLQYVVSLLAPGGRAAVLMPAGVAFRAGAEQELRARMVEDGVVECVLALPSQLFELTAIRTHIWFLRSPRGRAERVLFVGGEDLGHMATRTRRVLSDGDIETLVREYVSWNTDKDGGRDHVATSELSRAVTSEEIAAHDHQMDPGLYVRTSSAPQNGFADRAAAEARLARLSAEIVRLHERARAADLRVEEQIRRYGL